MSVRDITLGDTIDIKFTTRAFSTGVPTTLAGTPVISAYPGNSVTQLTAGITLTVDFDTVTGLHNVRVVATSGNGYAASTDYALVITTGTVGGVSVVGEVVGEFTTSRSAAAVDLANGTDGLGAIKTDTAAILADTGTDGVVVASGSKTGYSLTATTGLGNQTANITGNLSGSVGSVTGAVGSVTGAVGSVTAAVTIDAASVDLVWDEPTAGHVTAGTTAVALTDVLADTANMQPKLGTPAGADMSADIAAVKADTAAILVDTGTTLDTKLNDIQGAAFVTGTDSLQAIRDRGDAAWTTGAGGSPPTTLQNTTIATLASQTSFTLTAGSADNNAYVGATAIVTDSATSTQKAVGVISAYTGATKTVTLAADPGVFTMAVGDTIDIIAESPALPAAPADGAGGLPISDAGGLDLDALNTNVSAILTDTGTAGVIVATNNDKTGYSISGTKTTLDALNDIAATAVVSGGAINTTAGAVDNVTLVGTTTTNTDMRGTDNALLAASYTAPDNAGISSNGSAIAALNDLSSADVQAALVSMGMALLQTTIATLASQTSFTLTAGSADNDAYKGMMAVVTDSVTATQRAIGLISAYAGATKTITLAADPGVFAITAADNISILPAPKQLPQTLVGAEGSALGTTMRGTDSAALASVATEARLSELDAGTAGKAANQVDIIQTAAADIQTRLPAALVGGRMDSDVGATQTGALTTTSFAAGAIDAAALSTDAGQEIADALLDRSAGIETGLTPRQAVRIIAAALAGQLSGAATTTITIKAAGVPATTRIVATVDSSGNRTGLTLTP